MRRAMRFGRLISIILIAALLLQVAGPLHVPLFARAAYAAEGMDWDKMEEDFRKEFREDLRKENETRLRNEYSQKYGKSYDQLLPEEKRAVDQQVNAWLDAEAKKLAQQEIKKIKDEMEELEKDNPYEKPSDENYENEFRNAADEGYNGSILEELFDGIDGRPFNLAGKLLNLIAGIPIYDIITDPINGLGGLIIDKIGGKVLDEIPGIGDLIKIILSVELARIVKWLPFSGPGIQPGIPPKITLFDLENDPDFMMLVRTQIIELPVIIAAGLVMILACIPAVLVGKASEKKTYYAEAVALAGIAVIDAAIAATYGIIYARQNAWDDERQDNYKDDHKSLPGGGTFKDDLPAKLAIMRGSLGAGSGAASGNLYIDVYKQNANSWEQYVSSHVGAANTATADFATLEGIISKLGDDSFDKAKGYSQAIEARAQTYAFAVQQTTNLRFDVARQVDVRARQALDRQQRRAELHTAFGKAAKGGASWQAGTGY